MSEYQSLEGDQGKDDTIHDELLASEAGNIVSDLAAIESAIARGWTLEQAAKLFAGPATMAELRKMGRL